MSPSPTPGPSRHEPPGERHAGALRRPGFPTTAEDVADLRYVAVVEFHNYKSLAGNRAREGRWSLARRVAYLLGSPLIPLVRGGRAVRELRRLAGAAGEVLGLSIGAGDSPRRMVTFELYRLSHVDGPDRRGLLDGTIP